MAYPEMMILVMMVQGMVIRKIQTMNLPTMKIPMTNITITTTTTTRTCNIIWQMQSPHSPEMCNVKEMVLARKSASPILSMERTPPNSAHSSSNYDSVSMIVLALSPMTETKSTSQSRISKALYSPTLRIRSSSRTC